MGTFSDDFERANGPPGSNWYVTNANFVISSGKMYATTAAYARPANVTQSGAADASILIASAPTTATDAQVVVKANDNLTQGYRFYAAVSGGIIVGYLSTIGGTNGNIAISTQVGSLSFPLTLRLAYDNGALYGYVNGTLMAIGFHSQYASNTRVGFYEFNTTGVVDYFTTTSPDATTFAVSPTAVRRNGQPVYLTLTGSGTSWTAGSPGSPTFTASAGTLSGQIVASPTLAGVWFAPPDATENVTITDPSTSLTATIAVAPTVAEGGGGLQLKLTDEGAALVNRAADGTLPSLWTTNTYIGVTPIDATTTELYQYIYHYITDMYGGDVPGPGITSLLDKLWKITNNRNEQSTYAWMPSYDTSLKQDTEALRIWLESPPNDFSDMAAIVALLGGSPTVLSHVDLKTAIDLAATSGQAQAILDRLDELQGLSETNLTDLAGQLSQIRTNGNYDFQTILDAIAAIPGGGGGIDPGDVAAILAAIAAVALAVGVVGTGVTAVEATEVGQTVAIAAIAAELTAGIASILELLNTLKGILQAAAPPLYMPPVWPGNAHVTFGAVSDLATTVQVDGPMHGIEVAITATEPGTSFMQYDTVKSWRHIGGITFYNDRGMHETYQALNFGRALYVPKTMAIAQGVRLFKSHQPKGTVTPWTITS